MIAATLNSAETYFPSLSQWVPPKMPRPMTARRGGERFISAAETEALLDHLFRPRDPGEHLQAGNTRRRVGREFVFNVGGNTNPKCYRILRDAGEEVPKARPTFHSRLDRFRRGS